MSIVILVGTHLLMLLLGALGAVLWIVWDGVLQVDAYQIGYRRGWEDGHAADREWEVFRRDQTRL